jgi:hypothetical protein
MMHGQQNIKVVSVTLQAASVKPSRQHFRSKHTTTHPNHFIFLLVFYIPQTSPLFRGGGLASLNDTMGYAGGNFMFLVGPAKPDRP